MTGRYKNANWNCGEHPNDAQDVHHAILATLMDLRDELQEQNRILSGALRCKNFIQIPRVLKQIRANTIRPPRKRSTRTA